MKYYKINKNNPEQSVLRKAADVINAGGIIAYPTDTLYGLGANIYDEKAMDRLYKMKQRDDDKPVSILIRDISQTGDLVGALSEIEYKAASKFFPGKVTLLFKIKKANSIPGFSHLDRLGFRIPDSVFTQKLLNLISKPITTTSLNMSANKNIKNIKEIIPEMQDKIDMVIDAGPVESTKGSTVLDLSVNPPCVLRKGDLPVSEIVKKLGYEVITNITGKFVITFICSGNICRSPMGEGIMRKVLSKTKFRNIVEVNSAGTLKMPMTPAHIKAVEVSDQFGIDLNRHLSKHVDINVMREANIVIATALGHYKYLRSHFPFFNDKIILLKQWKLNKHLSNPSIADPIGHDFDFFEKTFKELQNEIRRILPFILNEIKTYTSENRIR